jgi:glutaredoxin/cytochrome c biogenesis protein CcdA
MRKIIILALLFLSFIFLTSPISAKEKTVIYFFWGDGCPHCESQKPFLEQMKEKYKDLEVVSLEAWKNPENAEKYKIMAAAYGVEARGVPATFIGEYPPIVGYSKNMDAEIEEKISACVEKGCVNPGIKAGMVKEEVPQVIRTPSPPVKDPKTDIRLNEPEGEEMFVEEECCNEENTEPLCLHLFGRAGCPQCGEAEKLLKEMEVKYGVNFHIYDLDEQGNQEIYELFKEKYGLTSVSHPVIFMGDRYLAGERAIKENVEKEIIRCKSEPCVCPVKGIKAMTPFMPRTGEVTPEATGRVNLPLVGEIDFSAMPLYAMTAIIAFVDGFNPCSLWLITFLLGIIIYSGSRKKIFLIGATFLIVTGAAYALFMVGLLNVFLYVGYIKWIQAAVALLAFIFAAVNIKDYFWYKKGISFTISDKYKPKMFKDLRNIMKDGKSDLAIVSGTALMALGVVLVELPCTAGFPMIWTNMIAQNHTEGIAFALLLLLYMIIYLLDEILVIGIATITLKASRFEEKHGRILKLIGGVIMLALALVMLFKPELMNDISHSIVIFGGAIALSFLILFIHRKILPKFGVKIGSEEGLLEKEEEV